MKKNIALFRSALIGDNIVALHAIYAIKYLYPDSHLVIYTNSIGNELFSGFDFINEIINTDNYNSISLIEHINNYKFDYFILTQCNRKQCDFINSSNAKVIISFLTSGSIFKNRFKTIFIPRNINKLAQYQRILKLTRLIDKKHYDKLIKNIDFSKIIIKPKKHNDNFINDFLIKNNINNKIVIINPFVNTTSHNITLDGWIKLTKLLSIKYPNINFIIPTYSANKDISNKLKLNNVFIFNNNENILNIVSLLKKSILLISPSTGISHLANNQNIPIIWLCRKVDKNLWRGDNMDSKLFIILNKPTKHITKTDETLVINNIIQLFNNFINKNNLTNN